MICAPAAARRGAPGKVCSYRNLVGAETYGHLATQMLWAAEASRATGRQPAPGSAYPTRSQPQTAADKEAGQ